MSDTVKTWSIQLELDEGFRNAVTLAWEDLNAINPRSIRVEYLCEPGTALDHLSVWSVRAGGYQDLVCDYWTWTSSAHPSGACFGSRRYSDKLAQILDFIMKNQGLFTRPADAGCHGLVQIHPPDADDRTEAATWMRAVQMRESEGVAGEASKPPDDHRQDEEACSRMDDEGYPNEHAATMPDAIGHSRVGAAPNG
jgi:hypothetical protein